MTNDRSKELFDKMWDEFCTQSLVQDKPKSFLRWCLEKFQLFKSDKDGIAILTSNQEIIWTSEQFQAWFPNVTNPNFNLNILSALYGVRFLYEHADQPMYATPFSEFQVTGKAAKGVIQTKNGNFFEISVHPWTSPGGKEPLMLLHVHDITERRELKNKLTNLHSICEQVSHREVLDEQKGCTERENFIIDGIQYLAKNQMHYEFLEVRKYDPITKTLPLCTHYGILKEAEQREIHARPTQNGTIGYVAVEKKAYICRDTKNDPYYLPGGETARSSLTVPIMFQGELLGVLNAESSQPDAFKEIDQIYAEIFAHEIALAMNFVRMFAREQNVGRQMTVEEIHGQIALPVKNILDLAAELGKCLGEEQIEAQHALYQIIKNAQEVTGIIQKVGQQLTPTDTVGPPERKELIEKWKDEFSGKCILLVDSSEELYRQGRELFGCLNCELEWARTGQVALDKMEEEMQKGKPYWAILASIKQKDYPHGSTQFFIDLARVYGRAHPPLVLLQELNVYDMAHTIVHVRTRYSASGQTGKPFTEPTLLKVIHETLKKCKNTKPCFRSLGKEYIDPMAEKEINNQENAG